MKKANCMAIMPVFRLVDLDEALKAWISLYGMGTSILFFQPGKKQFEILAVIENRHHSETIQRLET